MPTIWGYLEKVEELSVPAPNIQMRTVLHDGTVLRVRAKIGPQTLIARGIKPIDVSGLLKGEFLELSYRQGKEFDLIIHSYRVKRDHDVGNLGPY
jgi:hypothetical protein